MAKGTVKLGTGTGEPSGSGKPSGPGEPSGSGKPSGSGSGKPGGPAMVGSCTCVAKSMGGYPTGSGSGPTEPGSGTTPSGPTKPGSGSTPPGSTRTTPSGPTKPGSGSTLSGPTGSGNGTTPSENGTTGSGSGIESSTLTIEENGETFHQKITLTRKNVGNVLQVDVPAHGMYAEMSVIIAADSNGNWHNKDSMVFKMGNYSRISDLPSDFNPMEVFKATQRFVNQKQTLQREDENMFHKILVGQEDLSDEEIENLHPDIRTIVESFPVKRVKPFDITADQFMRLQNGGRVVIRSSTDGQVAVRSSTDKSTCASHMSMIFMDPNSGCWRWKNPVTGSPLHPGIGVHQIVVTTVANPNTPDPASISCCHDPNPAVPGPLSTDIADCCDRYFPSLCTCSDAFLNQYIHVSHADFTAECWGCANVKTRKNFGSLSQTEKNEMVHALNHVTAGTTSSLYTDIANYHGDPWMCNAAQTGPGNIGPCCKPHGLGDTINFLTWHRLFSYQMEWAMQEHDSSFTIPYWDWTNTNILPSIWLSGPIKAPLTSVCSAPLSTNTQRSFASFNPTDLGKFVRKAYSKRNLLAFSQQLIIPHNIIHFAIGCDMFTLEQASYDPIFYMHHAYVDYQFAYWQELQFIYGYLEIDPLDVALVAIMNLDLEPFNRASNPNPRSLRNCKGKNTFDHKKNFCYKYDALLFWGQTPTQFTTTTTTVTPGGRKRSAGSENRQIKGLTPLEFVLDEMERDKQNRVFIGVSMRKTGITSQQIVTICRVIRFRQIVVTTECVEAVKLSTFGKTQEPVYEDQISSPYLVQYEVTELFQSLGWPLFDSDINVTITSYNDKDGNMLPLDKTYNPVLLWSFAEKENTKGLHVLQVHFNSDAQHADTIFADPPYLVDIYEETNYFGRISVHYQRQTYRLPGSDDQMIVFGHNDHYQCERGRAYSRLPGQVSILQPSSFGWSLEGQYLDTSRPFNHLQGKLLLIVWCSHHSNMNEFQSKDDFDSCKVFDKSPREGPISYAVNTARPGLIYLGSGVNNQCRTGWKIAINIEEHKIGQRTNPAESVAPVNQE